MSKKDRRNRTWTEEEFEFLRERWGTSSVASIAKNLGRTVNAIKVKAQRLGLGDPSTSFNGITVNQLSKAINTSYSTLRYWIEHAGLPVRRKVFAEKSKVLVISYEDFWKWAEQNKSRLNLARVERGAIGPEPEWAKEKRRADTESMERKGRRPWTDQEEKLLISMVKRQSYTYPEISKVLRRTEQAIKRKLLDLGVQDRPVGNNSAVHYTEQDIQVMISMYEKGYGCNTIAERIGRTAISVRDKLDRLGYSSGRGKKHAAG